jgi:hypothetical protein
MKEDGANAATCHEVSGGLRRRRDAILVSLKTLRLTAWRECNIAENIGQNVYVPVRGSCY